MRWFAVLVMLACAACGSKSAEKRETSGGPAGDKPAAAPAATGPLTEADCDRLLDHWFALVIADKKKTAKPDEVPTEEDIAKTRARMAAETKEKCVGSPRAPYDWVMKAQTIAESGVCLEGRGQK